MIRPVRLYTHISPGSKKPPKKAVICVLPARTFNLSEPFSALKLALVLHRSKFVTIQQCSSWEADETLPWRADLIARDILEDDPETSHTDFSSREAIVLWAEEVYKANESKRRVSDMERRGASLRQGTNANQGGDPQTSTKENIIPRKGRSRPRTQRYFVVRKVIFCNAQRGLDNWIEVPKESIHALAPVWFNTPVEVVRRSICNEQEHLLEELLEAYATCSTCFLGSMTNRVRDVIERSLHGIFQAVQSVRLLCRTDAVGPDAEGEAAEVHNEATHRYPWNQLMQVITDIAAVPNMAYRKEPKLRYSEYSPPHSYTHNRVYRSDVTDLYDVILPPAPRGEPGYLAYKWHEDVTPEEMGPAAAQDEPHSGTPDGMLYLSISNVFRNKAAADAVSIWHPRLATQSEEGRDATDTWSAMQEEYSEPRGYGGSAFAECEPHRPFDAQARAKYQQSMQLESLEDPPFASTASRRTDIHPLHEKQHDMKRVDTQVQTPSLPALSAYFPLLVCEYRGLLPNESAEEAVTDQERLSLIALCTFMRLFNIARFPIFGLITSGSIGVLSSAWNEVVNLPVGKARDTTQNVICIADEQATKVDLCNPLDALNVATFVAYILVEHAPLLRALFSSNTSEVSEGYLLNKEGGTPREKALSLTAVDGNWHRPQSDSQASKRENATAKADLGSVPEQPED
ncbi:hypothetical protein PUNSTDRAFT_137186 [Punctularia strigosozonata HHB-11173 SS5]|uniref:uncharacterized protein n=1 Tax=Punctularia strigosozonata (strain HHB-11173) TaxID=741275 RepID=UPI0004417779|nr:uncharacterized protein PUNSTDRAFT_137186 [Punctularia strigosozonata HHB-11173 SS5]EIN05693.1 hypothetical protein PUNSTDRAFT_137186 [Punctularia strigosozonata HHB-11173 SS5]